MVHLKVPEVLKMYCALFTDMHISAVLLLHWQCFDNWYIIEDITCCLELQRYYLLFVINSVGNTAKVIYLNYQKLRICQHIFTKLRKNMLSSNRVILQELNFTWVPFLKIKKHWMVTTINFYVLSQNKKKVPQCCKDHMVKIG